jgi:hypothetical protein
MTRDEILRMAIQCQLVDTNNRTGIYVDALHEFAKLIAQHEREACIDIVAMFGGSIEIEAAIRARGKA